MMFFCHTNLTTLLASGQTEATNLALACFHCNRHKGPNIASIDIETNQVTLFFNPRQDNWQDHFQLDGATIQPLTTTGRVTARLLQFNNRERLRIRHTLIQINRYP